MEIRQISGIFIDTYHDSILGLSYGKILTESTLESIRFPTLLDNYKYKYLIEPNQLLQLEVIKTKKNWILRSINQSQVIYQPKDYQDFVVFCEAIKFLKSNIMEQQSTSALSSIISYFESVNINNSKINLLVFEKTISQSLGFA